MEGDGVRRIRKGMYIEEHIAGELYFIMDRVDGFPDKIKFWRDFAKEDEETYEARNQVTAGASALFIIMDEYSDLGNAIWMAYASPVPPSPDISTPVAKNVELYVSVNTVYDAPMYSNMGIQRSSQYIGPRHGRLSIPLHSFTAKVMIEEYGLEGKEYMITAPVGNMRRLVSLDTTLDAITRWGDNRTEFGIYKKKENRRNLTKEDHKRVLGPMYLEAVETREETRVLARKTKKKEDRNNYYRARTEVRRLEMLTVDRLSKKRPSTEDSPIVLSGERYVNYRFTLWDKKRKKIIFEYEENGDGSEFYRQVSIRGGERKHVDRSYEYFFEFSYMLPGWGYMAMETIGLAGPEYADGDFDFDLVF